MEATEPVRPPTASQVRWAVVNQAEVEELRKRTADEDFAALAMLMVAARNPAWIESLSHGDDEVRERWARIKRRG